MIKNSFLTILIVVVLCLFLVVGLQQYVRSEMLSRNLITHRQLSTFIIDSVDSRHITTLQHQLRHKLELLPGWLAAVYDSEGQLLWQSQDKVAGIEQKDISKKHLQRPWMSDEQEWVVSQHPLADTTTGKHKLTITLFSSKKDLLQQIQSVSNLIFAMAIIIGMMIWIVLNLHSRHFKADIRKYIRSNRKEFTHDSLTGLLNREILLDRIEHGLEQAKRHKTQVALLYIGLDHFQQINENFGHTCGDQVLRAVAERLLSASRDSDTLVRIEADQFALLMIDIHHQEEIDAVTTRITQVLETPVKVANKQCVISASIGISMEDIGEGNPDALVLNAYTAMMEKKKNNQV